MGFFYEAYEMVEEAKKMVVLTNIIESQNFIICINNNGLK